MGVWVCGEHNPAFTPIHHTHTPIHPYTHTALHSIENARNRDTILQNSSAVAPA